MIQNDQKKIAGLEALKYIKNNIIIGIGTGSTISLFINSLNSIKHKIIGAVSSSLKTYYQLKNLNIPLIDINNINFLDLYIDSADEINYNFQMIKGGGGALTKEKILASMSKKFICIIDETKLVNSLGKFPLPIEIIPVAKNLIINELFKMGGKSVYRKGIITENGNIILDVYNLSITNALKFEKKINNIPGVVTVGIFANRTADMIIIGNKNGSVKIIT